MNRKRSTGARGQTRRGVRTRAIRTDSRGSAAPGRNSRALALAAALTLALALAAPARAGYTEGANDTDIFVVAVDLTVLRPLGLATLALSSTLFVLALPFAAGTGQVATLADTLVSEPARFTFTREVRTEQIPTR